jgi:signal transduction histidine kinase/CheY-like chemotaxis protein
MVTLMSSAPARQTELDAPLASDSGGLRGRLFRRYARDLALLLSLALLVSGGIGAFFSYRDTRALVDELQREKARAAAARIGQFIQMVQIQLQAASISGHAGGQPDSEARHIELVRLLRVAPSVSEAAWIDAGGQERARVSRLTRDVVGGNIDRSGDPAVIAAREGRSWFGDIGFRRESEPSLEIAVAGNRRDDGVVIAGINLKFVSDVVAGIRVGESGKAYVVDARGRLIVHPDASKALRMTNLADQPPVRTALTLSESASNVQPTIISRSGNGKWTIAASARIDPPGWRVIVEQPIGEAFAPMFESLARTAFLLLVGVACAVMLSRLLVRRMIAPIRMLENGAKRIGEGHLEERVEVHTGDELESLAEQFNRMALRLRESYAGLEKKVEERTCQLEEANRAKSRFLAAASHDLRQPVHALGLFVAQLEETHDETARRRLIGKVAASSTAVSELIEALLDISKLDAGAVASQPAEFALQPLFDRIEHTFALVAREKGLRLRIRPTQLRLRTDPILLERILLNLCGNAIRYTAQGGAILTARVRKSFVRIEVWDTGIGVGTEQQSHIFEEFYQVSSATDAGSKGLGLGLAIVDRLVKLLELKVSVRSIPDRGSVFAVDVPIAGGAESGEPALSALLGAARIEGLYVMLIDDDYVARDATEGLLTQWGCRVRPAASGADALRIFSSADPPRLIICDYHLADRELGTDVIRQLRVLANADIPAVILSADATQALRDATVAAGLHLLHKPLNAARLRALMLHIAGSPGPAAAQA